MSMRGESNRSHAFWVAKPWPNVDGKGAKLRVKPGKLAKPIYTNPRRETRFSEERFLHARTAGTSAAKSCLSRLY